MATIKTKANTTFIDWFEAATAEFARRELPVPTYGNARGAFEVGDSPETWAEYVAGQPPEVQAEVGVELVSDMDEGEIDQEVAGLLYNHMKQNGWKSVERYDFGEVEIVTNSGVTYRLSVEIEDTPAA